MIVCWLVTEQLPPPAPVIRPPSSCWGGRGPPWPSTPAPGGTAPSSLSGSSWCPAAWRAWPWWWPAWRPHSSYCWCLWSEQQSTGLVYTPLTGDLGEGKLWLRPLRTLTPVSSQGRSASTGPASDWSVDHSDGLPLVNEDTSLEARRCTVRPVKTQDLRFWHLSRRSHINARNITIIKMIAVGSLLLNDTTGRIIHREIFFLHSAVSHHILYVWARSLSITNTDSGGEGHSLVTEHKL